jgi:hypothetical protein
VDGKRLFPDEVRAVWRHLPGLRPLVIFQLGFLGGVVDVWLVGIVRLSANNPFGAPAVWRMAIVCVIVAIRGVLSAR